MGRMQAEEIGYLLGRSGVGPAVEWHLGHNIHPPMLAWAAIAEAIVCALVDARLDGGEIDLAARYENPELSGLEHSVTTIHEALRLGPLVEAIVMAERERRRRKVALCGWETGGCCEPQPHQD